jgi:membrane fusion protein, heavy metal efflux system
MRSERTKLGAVAVLALALVASVALWAGTMPFTRTLLAQAAEQDDHESHDHDDHDDHDEAHDAEADDHDDHDETHDAEADDHDGEEGEAHDDHSGHAHAEEEEEGHDEHAGHDHGEEEAELSVRLTREQMTRFGVAMAKAKPGKLQRQIRLPGEIVVNADRTVHVVPPAGGVVRKVNVSVGDSVSAGQAMAFLESAELSEAKTQYLATLNELSCCSADLARAAALDASARELLQALEKSPTLDELQSVSLGAMGEEHSRLISAYAELAFARAEYEREKKLVEQDVSSRADFQTASNAYKKAFAEFVSARDGLAYQTQRSLLEARRSRENMELGLRSAGQRLRVLGVSSQEIHALKDALPGGCGSGSGCDNPECAECAARKVTTGPGAAEKAAPHDHREPLGVYPLRASFAGTVIGRHITLGEMLSNDATVFTVTDLSAVWVNLSVYQKDLPYVRRGQTVHIVLGEETPPVEGKIAFVSPIVDSATRTAIARVILPNPKGIYRPGLFVTADIDVSAFSVPVLVPKSAVQRIESQDVVFVPNDEGLAARPVQLGRSSRTHVEIVAGLRANQEYVARGAFQLKAQIVTSGLGAHAGHGH